MKPPLFYLFIFLNLTVIHGQAIHPCLTDGIEITTQSQIDNFPEDYPECNTIIGNVKISGFDITNLFGLGQIQTIKGNLDIAENDQLQRLTGIEQLDSIYGAFNITSNSSLQIIDALDSLKYVGATILINNNNNNLTIIESFESLNFIGGGLRIVFNRRLTSITGFQKIRQINGNFSIGANPELLYINNLSIDSILGNCIVSEMIMDNLLWLKYLKYIKQFLYISSNPAIVNLEGLDSLRMIGGDCTIENNSTLTSLSGLGTVQSIGGEFSISSNPLLASGIGVENLTSIGSDLTVQENPVLTGLQFASRLNSIPGRLIIHNNDVLNNLTGLDSLRVIDSDVSIHHNANLQSLQGLDSLTIIRGAILLRNNVDLDDIEALSQINPVEVTDVTIENSPLLSECAVESICDFLSAEGDALFANNATGCNSVEEVNAACLVGLYDSAIDSEISLSPNPTTGLIDLPYSGAGYSLIRLFDSQGNEISKMPVDHSSLDLSTVPPGLYFLVLENDKRRYTARVLKI